MHEHTSKLLHAINMHDYSSVQLTIRHLALRNQTIVHKLAGNLKLSPWFYLGRFSFGVGHHNAGSQLLLTLNTITSYLKKVAGNTLNSISSSRCRYIYIIQHYQCSELTSCDSANNKHRHRDDYNHLDN